MTLDEMYQRMDGQEIDERMALAIMDTPEYKEKVKKEAEEERINNMSAEEQAELLLKLFNGEK